VVLQHVIKPRPAKAAGRALYASAASQARDPWFYRSLGVADTPEGRFELYTLHVALIVLRLKGQGAVAAETAQHLFEAFIRALDDALREMGVGDLSVPKKMKRLGEAFYGRVRSYEAAFAAADAGAELRDVLARTVLEGSGGAGAARLAAYAAEASEALAQTPLDELLKGRVRWQAPEGGS